MIDSTLLVFWVGLAVGVVALIIGLVARSIRVGLGCAITMLMVAFGISAAMFIWQLFNDWQFARIVRLQ